MSQIYKKLAEQSQDWVRIEFEAKSYLAHELTSVFLSSQSDLETKNIILSAILDKYMLFYKNSGRLHPITKRMLEELENKNFKFTHLKPQDNSFEKSLTHIKEGSGLFPIFWKADQIWGEGSSEELMMWLLTEYKTSFFPNPTHNSWLSKHKYKLSKTKKPWMRSQEYE